MQVTNKNTGDYFKSLFKIIFFGANVFALLFLFSFFLVWNVSPVKFTPIAYIGLVAPFVILVNLFFLIFWLLFRSWKLCLINFICFLICYNPVLSYSPLNVVNYTQPESSIKVLSYNVRGFNWKFDEEWSKNPIITYVKSVDADIVCFQEYLASTNDKFSSSINLQKALEVYPYYHVTPLRNTRGGYEYGLACFSKYPIIEVEQIPIVSTDNGSVLYKLNINGKIITLVNNHLESNRLTLADKKLYKAFYKKRNSRMLDDVAHNIDNKLGRAYKLRAPQADMIDQYVKNQNTDGVIVCGDFNDTPISYVYHKVKEELVDSYTESGFGPGITYHENYFWFRIDYILHSKNMNAYKFHIDKVKYSDHYPVWTYLNFK